MGYNVDLKRISILCYMETLKKQNLLPGRRILLENIEENFRGIAQSGVRNLAELKRNLSSAGKLSAFSAKTGIPENYLIILKREMGSLEQKPVAVADFPNIAEAIISILRNKGIKTSKDVFNLTIDRDTVSSVSNELGVAEDELLELNSLCGLVRINGIGPAAARTIYESGYKSIGEIANAKAAALLASMNKVNADKQYYKAKLGELEAENS